MPRRRKRDQDGIYQRPDSPYWWATIPDGRGGAARRSTRIPVAEDPRGLKANTIRAQWMLESASARTPGREARTGHTFDELMLAYLGQVTPRKRAPDRDTWSAKQLYPAFTGRILEALSVADARAYLAQREQDGVRPATVNKEIGLLSAAINWARRELEWDIPNPFQGRRQREPAGRNRWLTREDAAALEQAARRSAKAPHLPDFIRIGLYTGMRPGEILGLEWRRVDLEAGLVYFGAQNQKSGTAGSVPLNHAARDALLSRSQFHADHCPESPWVFCSRSGERIASVKTGFKLAVQRAGLVDVHPHDLRRTFGSWLVQAGVDIRRVSELMRHSDIRITAQVYAHLAPQDLAAAVEVLDMPQRRGKVSRSGFTLPEKEKT